MTFVLPAPLGYATFRVFFVGVLNFIETLLVMCESDIRGLHV